MIDDSRRKLVICFRLHKEADSFPKIKAVALPLHLLWWVPYVYMTAKSLSKSYDKLQKYQSRMSRHFQASSDDI